MTRANPFSDLADNFETKSQSKPVEAQQIERIASDMGFPSRQAVVAPVVPKVAGLRRRYTTGRNQQLNVKATSETVERFYRLADQQGVPLGALLEQALQALEQATQKSV